MITPAVVICAILVCGAVLMTYIITKGSMGPAMFAEKRVQHRLDKEHDASLKWVVSKAETEYQRSQRRLELELASDDVPAPDAPVYRTQQQDRR